MHLNLDLPEYVRVFPDFKAMKKTPSFIDDVNGSKFAYSAPFQASFFTVAAIFLITAITAFALAGF